MKRAPLSRLCLRNGAHTTYAYDRGGRLTRLANAHTSGYLGVSFDYEYDANSNITRIAQDFNGVDVAHEYAYDELNRLTREKTCDYDDAYSYDNVGNRTALTRVAGGVTKATAYSHNAAHELTQLVYDENGTAQYTKTYGYDAAGRTTRVTKQGGGLTTVVHTYDWDAADRLTRAQVDTGGNVKTIEYAYNAAGLRVRRVDTSTNVTKLYSYQGHNLASIQKSQSGAYTANEWAFTVAPGMIANALERHQVSAGGGATTSQYYQYDHRGNVVAVTDSTGDIQYGYQYDAFGNIMFSFDEGAAAAPTDDILFTGKDLDADTGLYYFNARWYDPEVARFLSRGPFKPNEEHAYGFCRGDPLSYVDPTGAVPLWLIVKAASCGLSFALAVLWADCMIHCLRSYAAIYNNPALPPDLRYKYGSSPEGWADLCLCECSWIWFGPGLAAGAICLGSLIRGSIRKIVKL